MTTICLTQCNTSPPHRVVQVVYCGLWNVGPLLFNGCVKLLDIGRNWNTLSYTPIQSIPNMLNGWHVRWVCWPCKNWDVFSFQKLCTDPCNMGPCIIMLQHEVMVVDEWHNNGPHALVTVSLCIQNAINKMHLCSLSITYACPYHNSTATMGHSIHNIHISKPLTHTTPYTLSAICPVQWKPGFIREENTSPKCQMPSNVSICPLKSVMTTNCSQVETQMRMMSMQMSFPETVFDSLCRIYLAMQTDCCSSWPGGWAQTILEVKMLDVEVLGWCGYTWSAVMRLRLDVLPNSLKCLWLMVEKLTLNSQATALVDIPAVSMPIARSLKTCDICGIVLCDKTAHFSVAFYCGQPNAHLCNNHAVLSWYATPVRWMDYLGKGEVLTNTDLYRFVNNIWEK